MGSQKKNDCEKYPFIKAHCNFCGKKLTGRQERWCSSKCNTEYYEQHYWTSRRKAALKRDKHKCVKCGQPEVKLEVNHINPLIGSGYNLSCKHHLENLETVCHPCHVQITNQQRKDRKLTKKK